MDFYFKQHFLLIIWCVWGHEATRTISAKKHTHFFYPTLHVTKEETVKQFFQTRTYGRQAPRYPKKSPCAQVRLKWNWKYAFARNVKLIIRDFFIFFILGNNKQWLITGCDMKHILVRVENKYKWYLTFKYDPDFSFRNIGVVMDHLSGYN